MSIPNLDDRPLGDLISLASRVAVVTGGAKGIGRGVARRLAEAGAAVLVADLDDAAGHEAAGELAAHGVQAMHRAVDVRNADEVEAVADAAVSELGGLDIWANIAGVYPVRADEFQVTPALTDAEWDRMIGINLTGTFHGARAAAKRMIDAGKGGVIINVQSTVTQKVPAPGFSHYVASKGAIEALTKSLAVELGEHGIRVLSISPTMVATPGMLAQKPVLTEAFGNVGDPHLLYGSRLPLRRIATEDEIGRVALFAASDLAAIMTGSVIAADAGDLAV
ncbi:MAG TPA: SDR family NAD(P)-dependent oxidoreductase [Gaiellaceae bacterium]|nr:SDR family NAD(P)-dependent oxidoreductase [Gaiellaceae bacterium]